MVRGFGELELTIVRIVGSRGQTSVREVHEALGSENAYTTVMTVMNRLVKKGELSRQKMGRHYEYTVATQRGLLDRLKEKVFGGRSAAMISYLIEEGEVTEEELAEVEALIRARRGS